MRVRLIKKLAPVINGIDLTARNVGDVFDCSDFEARMLVSEHWAEWAESEPPAGRGVDAARKKTNSGA